MHTQAHPQISPDALPRNRYILPTSLTAIACFFSILFAGAKVSQIVKMNDISQPQGTFAVAPSSVASR